MIKFVLRKIVSKKWMIASLLIGNLLLVSIAASCALYENAIMQKMLTSNLADYMEDEDKYPGDTTMTAVVREVSAKKDLEMFTELESMAQDYHKELGVDETYFITHYLKTVTGKSELFASDSSTSEVKMALSSYSDIESHIQITTGELYSDTLQDDNVIEVIVPKRTFVNMNLMIGQEITLKGLSYTARIVGVFEPTDAEDTYWYSSPSNWMQSMIMAPSLFESCFMDGSIEKPAYTVDWISVVDYESFKGNRVDTMLSAMKRVQKNFEALSPDSFKCNYMEIFEDFTESSSKLKVTLLVLQMPVYFLLAAFIFMVSRQMLEMEQNEIAIYKSRGASKKQILLIYLVQSLILNGISIVLGIPLAYLITQIIGSSNAFLEFVSRSALPISITLQMWLYVLVAVLVSLATMVLPAFRYANVTIVAHKQRKQKKNNRPMWQKIFLDIICMGIGIYGYYLYNQNTSYLADAMTSGSSLGPILYLSSSVFILGAALFVLRVFPLIVKLIFRIGKRFWSPALYASFMRILRSRSNQGFLMVFLMMTVSLGIFNAQAARTINQNGEDKIYYSTGADLVVRETWDSTSALGSAGVLIEPDYNRYQQIEGVEETTRVLHETVNLKSDKANLDQIEMMAINTKEFGEVAWFKDSLLPVHWYNYLNAISQNSSAVLVSSNFKDNLGFEIGDVITYSNANGSARGVIYGFVDYWPGYSPYVYSEGTDGLIKENNNYLVVCSFDQIQTEWAAYPYEVWMKIDGSTQGVYDWAEENEITFTKFEDATANLITWKNDPTTQATNGVLTVDFIVVLILCATGFLIFWILSIRSRELQFGIFRAMGMTLKEIMSMLGNEQIFISGISIVMGAVIGKIASTLYVPMIQVAYSSTEKLIPLEIASATSDSVRLFIVIGVVVLACMAILVGLIRRMKIAQALKLGED